MTPSRYRSVPERSTALPFAIAGVALLALGLGLLAAVFADEPGMNARDLVFNTWLRDLAVSVPALEQAGAVVSWFADGERNVWTAPIVIVTLLIFRRWRWALFFLLASQGGFLLSNVIKRLIARERPPFLDFSPEQLYMSFPSGHTFAGITVWVSLAIVVFFVLPRPWSTVLGWVCVAIGVMEGPSRLLLGKHWLTDVLGAWLLAGGWLMVSWAVFVYFIAPRPKDTPDEPAQVQEGGGEALTQT